ncbi:Uncharacterised protein [Porphyromonas cangingivalis]|uniref:Uncharacterized protein n=1 Tax=Porphyromonas cangingivalis TaxID=36874 RepID=A0A1T4LXA5_PORCN|nr:hypothetical protein SAMN02745205_01307 [Porphyromonas cangingivalis]VEJ01913.1 Uncharacterised protein [Porphyromonas cangingivalis]
MRILIRSKKVVRFDEESRKTRFIESYDLFCRVHRLWFLSFLITIFSLTHSPLG